MIKETDSACREGLPFRTSHSLPILFLEEVFIPIRFPSLLSVLILVVLLAGCSGGGSDGSPAGNLQASVNSNWNEYKQAHGVSGGGMAVYLETPTGNYFASSGMPAGVDQNTHFRIASVTKTFTAAAVMFLAQQGKLDIDDTIVSLIPGQGIPYVPDTLDYKLPYKATITIRQLLAHTAGVWDIPNQPMPSDCPAPYKDHNYEEYMLDNDPTYQFSPDKLVAAVATCQAKNFAPGIGWHYSNTGYSILATIIERVSGLPYDQFLMQNLIQPNGLSSTSVPMLATDRTMPAPFNRGYLYQNGAMTDVTEANVSASIAEGNIISTPVDIGRWTRRLIRGEAGVNTASINTMMTATPQAQQEGTNYGLGIIYKQGLGYGHTGETEGYMSWVVYDHTVGVTTVIYFNIWDVANLATDQVQLRLKAMRDARAAVGY